MQRRRKRQNRRKKTRGRRRGRKGRRGRSEHPRSLGLSVRPLQGLDASLKLVIPALNTDR